MTVHIVAFIMHIFEKDVSIKNKKNGFVSIQH